MQFGFRNRLMSFFNSEKSDDKLMNKFFDAFIIFIIFVVFLWSMLHPCLHAEIDSFTIPIESLQRRCTFVSNQDDIEMASIDFPSLNGEVKTYDDLRSSKLIKLDDDKYMSYYMPIYPLLCIPMKLLLTILQADQERCFTITNAIFISAALFFIYKKLKATNLQRLLLIVLLMISPIWLYINYIGYEVMIFSFLTISLVLYINGRKKLSAVVLSIAGIANPCVMAVGIVMVLSYLFKIFSQLKKNSLIELINKHWLETIKYALCFFPFLIFYGIFVITTSSGGNPATGATTEEAIDRILAYIFDLNLGYASFMPIAVVLFFVIVIIDLIQRKFNAIEWFMFLMGTVFSFSLMPHINCGMFYCARYVIWSYPIIYFYLVCFGCNSAKKIIIKSIVYLSIILSSTVIVLYNILNSGLVPAHYHNPFASYILDTYPNLYNPYYATFNCRTNHIDGAYWITEPTFYISKSTGNITKLIVKADREYIDSVLERVTGDKISIEYLTEKMDSFNLDGKYHYINFPPHGKYSIREKNVQEIYDLQDGDLVVNASNFDLKDISIAYMESFPATIKPKTYYKVQLELPENYNFNNDSMVVDFCGTGYDNEQQEASHFIVDGKFSYVFFFNSGDTFEVQKDINIRIFTDTNNGLQDIFISELKVTELISQERNDVLKTGSKIDFSGEGYNADRYNVYGISSQEGESAWSDGNELGFSFIIPEYDNEKKYYLSLDVSATYNGQQEIIVKNGSKTEYKDLVDGSYNVKIPFSSDEDGYFEIVILLPNAVSPYSLRQSEDKRLLALSLMSATLHYE